MPKKTRFQQNSDWKTKQIFLKIGLVPIKTAILAKFRLENKTDF